MIDVLLKKIFGTKHERDVKRMMPVVDTINALEPSLAPLDEAALRAKSEEFKKQIEGAGPLEDVLPEAFAVCREAARRTVGMRHFDVQLIGGMVLHEGTIAEMATGEGKTLVATLPAYLNGLTGRGVHIVTVNDYLAKRDAQWMGPIYDALGLSVGVIQHEASFLYDPAFVTSDIRLTRFGRARARRRTEPTSPTARTTSLGSTTSATTCASRSRSWCSASSTTPSSTRWTRF